MAQIKTSTFWVEMIKKLLVVLIASVLNALALNKFLIPANIYAAGINGISQLMSSMLGDFVNIHVSTGLLILLFNIPIALLGWYKIGRDFTFYSFLTVAITSIFLAIVPIGALTDDFVMNAVAGGALTGAAVGISMKYGFSTGGMDIVSLVLSKTTGRSVGNLMLMMNAIIIGTAGVVYGWEYALYTLLSLFVTARVLDAIHTSHQKVTAMIVTRHSTDVVKSIHSKLIRGLTVLPSKGGYTGDDSAILMIVITRYEMYDLEQAVKESDPNAFVNIIETSRVLGEFWDVEQQKKSKSS